MSNFAASQIIQVESGTLTVEMNGGVGFVPYDKHAITYKARDRNKPVNMDAVSTFEPSEYQNVEEGNQVRFPIIAFYKKAGGVLTWWYYPPTDDGKHMRDDDFNFLMENFAMVCPESTL